MKALKLILLFALLITAFTSCTKQDLNEDDVLRSPVTEEVLFTGGQEQD